MKRIIATCLLVGVLGGGSVAAAGEPTDWFGAGGSGDWRDMLRGQEIGGTRTEPASRSEGGPSNLGAKLKAGGLSFLFPGAGQILYNGDTTKGWLMVAAEVTIWGAYFAFDRHADAWADDYREYAQLYAGVEGDHDDYYWQAVGRHLDSDSYYESQLREARAFGEAEPGPLPADETWQWRNEDYRDQYQVLRANATKSYDRRDFMIMFSLLNTAYSVFDAVRGAHADEGVHLSLDVSPSLRHPEARCGLAGSF